MYVHISLGGRGTELDLVKPCFFVSCSIWLLLHACWTGRPLLIPLFFAIFSLLLIQCPYRSTHRQLPTVRSGDSYPSGVWIRVWQKKNPTCIGERKDLIVCEQVTPFRRETKSEKKKGDERTQILNIGRWRIIVVNVIWWWFWDGV